MPYSDFFKTHPPRCLAGFTAELTDFPEHDGLELQSRLDDGDPESLTPTFVLSCECGSRRHFVHGYQWTNPELDDTERFISPIDLKCGDCGKKTDLLDTNIQGYDAELGHGSMTARGKGEPAEFACPTCGRTSLEVFVQLEYPDDLFEEDDEEFAGREQDLFTWVSLFGRCAGCSQLLEIADFECA